MAHVSLYRKYRSQTFDEVVGQPHITATLANALADGRLHHAYLFTGPRGTGKTSTARILAKAVNCVDGPTPTPCNACEQCTAITQGSSIDVIEIDAASHGGVDDVRDLRDRVAFAPASARMKVYIVDECHMLSTAGWNAFLKTVEEPPGHVLFVFATTEPHKVLPTILSRTQRFDFKRIAAADLAAHCERIAQAEGVTLEPAALDLVVRAGDGSARDTLSVLEQVVAFTGPEVTTRGVVEVLGSVSGERLHELTDLLAAGDVPGVIRLVDRLADAGQDLRQLARDLVEHLRRLFLLQTAPDADLVEGAPEQLARLREQTGRLGLTELLRAMDLVADAQAQMRRGHVRLPLELALCKIALPEASGDPGALAARLDRLERRTRVDVSAGTDRTAVDPAPAGGAATDQAPAKRPAGAEPAPGSEAPAGPPVGEAPAPAAPAGPPVGEAPAPAAPADPAVGEAPAPAAPADPAAAEVPAASPPPAPAPPTAAAPVDLELVRGSWPAILEQAKGASRRFHAFLTQGHPAAAGDGELVLEFGPNARFHAEQVASEEWREEVARILTDVLGEALAVRCVVTDRDPTPAASEGPGETGAEEAEVLDSEAAEAAGELPDEDEAHAQALETLTRDLGARVVDD